MRPPWSQFLSIVLFGDELWLPRVDRSVCLPACRPVCPHCSLSVSSAGCEPLGAWTLPSAGQSVLSHVPLTEGGRKGLQSWPPSFRDGSLTLPPGAGAEAARMSSGSVGGRLRTIRARSSPWSQLWMLHVDVAFPSSLSSPSDLSPRCFWGHSGILGPRKLLFRRVDRSWLWLPQTAWSFSAVIPGAPGTGERPCAWQFWQVA